MPRPPRASPAWRNRVVELRAFRPSELEDHPLQWRTHPDAQRAALRGLFEEVGIAGVGLAYQSPSTGQWTSIDGHLRKSMGDIAWPHVVLDVTDEEAALLLATHDPLSGLAESNADQLAALLQSVQSGDAAVQQLLRDLAAEEGLVLPGSGGNGSGGADDPGPQIDRADELRQKWGVEVGQIWSVGDHRVLCGDCTDKTVIERLIQHEKVTLLVTDPPYGQHTDTSWLSTLHIERGKPANKSDALLVGDDGTLDLRFLFAFPHWLVWGFPYVAAANATGWLVWDKWPGTDGTGLGSPVELASTNLWTGFRLVRCMWAGYYRAAGETREAHPTQKPLGVIQPYVAATDDPIVLDPFLGSGTTLIACENLGRRCYGCEIDPGYVAVTLERWATLTGDRPVKVEA